MSLISARNFIAPLQNKVHLGTIILVAVCFAFLRGAGASFSTYSKSYERQYPRTRTQATTQRYAPSRANQQKSRFEQRRQPQRPAQQQGAPQQQKQQKTGSLFDLEKELGLK